MNPMHNVHGIYLVNSHINEAHRIAFFQFRLPSHNMKVKIGRWFKLPIESWLCQYGDVQTASCAALQSLIWPHLFTTAVACRIHWMHSMTTINKRLHGSYLTYSDHFDIHLFFHMFCSYFHLLFLSCFFFNGIPSCFSLNELIMVQHIRTCRCQWTITTTNADIKTWVNKGVGLKDGWPLVLSSFIARVKKQLRTMSAMPTLSFLSQHWNIMRSLLYNQIVLPPPPTIISTVCTCLKV